MSQGSSDLIVWVPKVQNLYYCDMIDRLIRPTEVYVVNNRTELVGIITLKDIAKTLIVEETFSQTLIYQQLI